MKSSTFRQRILPLLVFLTLIASSLASPIALLERDVPDISDVQSGPYNQSPLTWQPIILGIVAILTGIYFCFFGYRFFRLTMFVVGFWFFGNIAYIILSQAGVANSTVLLIVSIAIGIVLGLLLALCYQVGIYLLGALAGYTLALWILSFKAGGVIPGRTGQIIFIVVLVILGVALSIFFERFLLIFATSFLGAFLIIFGIDIFARTGYVNILNGILGGSVSSLQNEPWQVYAMLAATFVLFLIGVAVQYATSWRKLGNGYRTGVPAYDHSCCGRRRKLVA